MREVRQAAVERRVRRRRSLRRGFFALVVVAIVIAVIALVSAKPAGKENAGSTTTTTAASSTTTTTTSASAAIAPTCPPAGGSATRHTQFTAAPPVCIDESATYTATVETDLGTFVITMDAAKSPAAVNNFVFLARYHYYDGTTFFRVINDNILQGGSWTNTDSGSPGYSFTGNTPSGCTNDCYPIGSVATANSGTPSTNGSQFFIVEGADGTSYPADYTLFGTVTSGMSVVQAIAADANPSNAYAPKVVHHIIKVTITQT